MKKKNTIYKKSLQCDHVTFMYFPDQKFWNIWISTVLVHELRDLSRTTSETWLRNLEFAFWTCKSFNPRQPSVAFHIEMSHLFCRANAWFPYITQHWTEKGKNKIKIKRMKYVPEWKCYDFSKKMLHRTDFLVITLHSKRFWKLRWGL